MIRPPRGVVRRGRLRSWGAALLGLLLGAAPGVGQTSALDSLFDTPPIDGVHVGALVVDARSGEVLYARNAGRRFVPASNQKVLTTAAALARLGPGHRFRTTVSGVGRLSPEGVLVGDLVVRGDGDPTLSERYHDDAEDPLRTLADQLWRSGVRRVRGDLVIDATAWDSTRVESTWMWGDLPYGYAALGGPFVVGEGMARVEVRAEAPGAPVRLRWWPRGRPDRFVSSARSVAPSDSTELSARLRTEPPGVEVAGGLPALETDTLELSVQDPLDEAGAVLARILGDRGIQLDGDVRVRFTPLPCDGPDACPAGTVLARLESPTLMEIVEGVLEPSQNWMAEQLVHHLALADSGRGGARDGLRAMRRILQSDFGLDSLDIDLRDGSGLSAYNLVTPRAMVRLLQGVLERPWGPDYVRALAEPGEDDSTLERRLAGLEGRVFAKTGTITHVNSLSGYVDTADGRRLAFALLTNGSGLPASRLRRVVDRALRRVADLEPGG